MAMQAQRVAKPLRSARAGLSRSGENAALALGFQQASFHLSVNVERIPRDAKTGLRGRVLRQDPCSPLAGPSRRGFRTGDALGFAPRLALRPRPHIPIIKNPTRSDTSSARSPLSPPGSGFPEHSVGGEYSLPLPV